MKTTGRRQKRLKIKFKKNLGTNESEIAVMFPNKRVFKLLYKWEGT